MLLLLSSAEKARTPTAVGARPTNEVTEPVPMEEGKPAAKPWAATPVKPPGVVAKLMPKRAVGPSRPVRPRAPKGPIGVKALGRTHPAVRGAPRVPTLRLPSRHAVPTEPAPIAVGGAWLKTPLMAPVGARPIAPGREAGRDTVLVPTARLAALIAELIIRRVPSCPTPTVIQAA